MDVSVASFGTRVQRAFFDVRVFDLNARRYRNRELENATKPTKKKRKDNTTRGFYRLKMVHLPYLFSIPTEQ